MLLWIKSTQQSISLLTPQQSSKEKIIKKTEVISNKHIKFKGSKTKPIT